MSDFEKWLTRQLLGLATGISVAIVWAFLDYVSRFLGTDWSHDYLTVTFAAMAGALTSMGRPS